MKERITQIIQKEEMTAAQFAEKIGISPSSLSHILSGRNNPSLEVVMKIHKACTYVNLSWLLYGDGQMEEQAKAMETKEFSATAGGGAVEVTVSGLKKVLKLKLNEEVVDPDDVEMLEDLLVAALNEALDKVDAESAAAMSKFSGGMPGLF